MPQPSTARPHHDEIIRLHSLKWPDRAIADHLGISYGAARDYRVSMKLPAWPRGETIRQTPRSNCSVAEHQETVKRLHAEGYSDQEIADQIGAKRKAVEYYRKTWLQLPTITPDQRRNRAQGRRRQEQTLGCSPSDIRAEQLWSYAIDRGWPAGMRQRCVEVIEALLVHGPQTMKSLRTLIQKRLTTNDPQGTATANLMARGYVTVAKKSIDVGHGIKRRVDLYCPTPLARAVKEEWSMRQQTEEKAHD